MTNLPSHKTLAEIIHSLSGKPSSRSPPLAAGAPPPSESTTPRLTVLSSFSLHCTGLQQQTPRARAHLVTASSVVHLSTACLPPPLAFSNSRSTSRYQHLRVRSNSASSPLRSLPLVSRRQQPPQSSNLFELHHRRRSSRSNNVALRPGLAPHPPRASLHSLNKLMVFSSVAALFKSRKTGGMTTRKGRDTCLLLWSCRNCSYRTAAASTTPLLLSIAKSGGFLVVGMGKIDQLVFEDIAREKFPKLVNHLDYLGVQVAWIIGPWFLSIFVNMIPWESVIQVWVVLLFEGNRVMLFRTSLALLELYAITENRLNDLREKHRPTVLEVVEERARAKKWKDSKGLSAKLYSFKHNPAIIEEKDTTEEESGLSLDSEPDSVPDPQDQVDLLKVELCRVLEEKRSAILRSEELDTALMEIVKLDNRRELSARLEHEVAELRQALNDKTEQEAAMLKVLMYLEQEQKVTEEARISAEQEALSQRHALDMLQGKYDKATSSLTEMERRVKVAESMLEATLQYESGQAKALSPRASTGSTQGISTRKIPLLSFGLWRDKNKGSNDSKSTNEQEKTGEEVQEPSANI